MKPRAKLIGISAIAGLLAVAQAQAHCGGHCHGARWHGGGCHGAGGWGTGCRGAGGQSGNLNVPKTVVTMNGEVTSVEKSAPANGTGAGVHLRVKTKKRTLVVLLGPSWYLDNQEVRIQANDRIKVTGFRISLNGKPAILAAQVKKGDDVLKLRDENGLPRWTSWRGR